MAVPGTVASCRCNAVIRSDTDGAPCADIHAFCADAIHASLEISVLLIGCNSDYDTLSLAGTYEEPNPGVQR